MQIFNVSIFRIRILKAPLSFIRCTSYKTNSYGLMKRGFILDKMVADKDRRKNWHFNILNNKPKCRNVFEKVHKPHRRQKVLNALFVRNITDVISTGDIVPEILGYGMEITGIKISPCCKILNVFWQIPIGKSDTSEDLAKLLSEAAPKIRAELISRNVLGHVPFIYFLRDCTNEKIAAFEEALKNLDVRSDTESPIIADDDFTKNIFSFKTPKVREKVPSIKKVSPQDPQKPLDMKSDVFGLNHEMMIEKIITSKKKSKKPQQSAVICPENLKEGDLFSKIPGICFQADTPRDKILKQFEIERKICMQKKDTKLSADDYQNNEADDADDNELECDSYLDDFIEEDTSENSKN